MRSSSLTRTVRTAWAMAALRTMRALLTLFFAFLAVCTSDVAPAFAASSEGGQVPYVSQGQLVAYPAKNGSQALLVLTLQFDNPAAVARPAAFRLPEGATQPALLESSGRGWRLYGGRLSDSALPAGVTTVVLTARLPLGGSAGGLTFDEPIAVRTLFVVVPEGSLFVSAQGGFLTSSQTFAAGGLTFRRFTKLDIQPGDPWSMSVTLLPTAGGRQAGPLPGLPVLDAVNPRNTDLEAIGNVLLAAAILVVGILSIRSGSRSRRAIAPLGAKSRRDLIRLRKETAAAWLDLERLHEQGGMDEAQYERTRADLKRRAVDIDMSLRA